ncbi:MAG: flagellar protein FlgN [Lachnospiraceae bacterium]|nr:flagellar protein FlgN [Lachnospiraceae bacterium]
MASLMEELIGVLQTESGQYEELLELSKKKTPILVSGKIDELQKITDEEQILVDNINSVDKKRVELLSDIGNVLNEDTEGLTIQKLADLVKEQPEQQKQLLELHDKLKRVLGSVQALNEQNKALVNQMLEMVAFDMNLLKSMKQAPETANYNKQAANTGDLFIGASKFDAKQ